MSFQFLPGTKVTILNDDYKPAGEVTIECYLQTEQSYRVWWTYQQTGEREMIKVVEWRLQKLQKH